MQRHRFDLLSLLAGLLFTTVAVLSLADLLPLRGVDLRLLGPIVLVVFGLVMVVGTGRRGRDGDAEEPDTDADLDADRDADLGPGPDGEGDEVVAR